MRKTLSNLFQRPKTLAQTGFKSTVRRVDKHPFIAFFTVLLILFLLILAGSILFKPPQQATEAKPEPKSVSVFRIGGAPKIQLQAKIEKSGVVKIVAQTAGIVQNIKVTEGQSVGKGQQFVTFSSNYQGGNAPAVQSALAAKQYELAKTNQDANKDIIARQRDQVNKTRENTEDIRQITDQSVSETQNLVNAQNDVLSMVNKQIDYLAAQPGANDPASTTFAALTQAKSSRAQLILGVNSANQGLRTAQYQTDTSKPPNELADIARDIALKQLDLQEKVLGINTELARLQLSLAYISESLMYPAAPCAGVVERVYVKVGQAVTPGTVLVSMTYNQGTTTAIAQVPTNIAQSITRIEPSVLHLDTVSYNVYPEYITTEATDNNLHSVFFTIPDEYQHYVTEGSYITVDVPIGVRDTNPTDPFIPLDAIYQTQSNAYLFVVHNGKAESREIQLGDVYGRFVGVDKGVQDGDEVILDRNVINGDPVKVNN
jgi:multidrug efflux pump subunit AcrA (membrane-fusion protein)